MSGHTKVPSPMSRQAGAGAAEQASTMLPSRATHPSLVASVQFIPAPPLARTQNALWDALHSKLHSKIHMELHRVSYNRPIVNYIWNYIVKYIVNYIWNHIVKYIWNHIIYRVI